MAQSLIGEEQVCKGVSISINSATPKQSSNQQQGNNRLPGNKNFMGNRGGNSPFNSSPHPNNNNYGGLLQGFGLILRVLLDLLDNIVLVVRVIYLLYSITTFNIFQAQVSFQQIKCVIIASQERAISSNRSRRVHWCKWWRTRIFWRPWERRCCSRTTRTFCHVTGWLKLCFNKIIIFNNIFVVFIIKF